MTDEVLAFTGPSKISDEQIPQILRTLNLLEHPTEAHYGCAHGVDTMAQGWGMAFWTDSAHRLYVPAAAHNHDTVDHWRKPYDEEFDVEVIDCPRKSTPSDTYRIRNQMMLFGATRLIAFSHRPYHYRSGEWMTINMAENEFAIPVEIVVLY